jgi:hypothetical protein
MASLYYDESFQEASAPTETELKLGHMNRLRPLFKKQGKWSRGRFTSMYDLMARHLEQAQADPQLFYEQNWIHLWNKMSEMLPNRTSEAFYSESTTDWVDTAQTVLDHPVDDLISLSLIDNNTSADTSTFSTFNDSVANFESKLNFTVIDDMQQTIGNFETAFLPTIDLCKNVSLEDFNFSPWWLQKVIYETPKKYLRQIRAECYEVALRLTLSNSTTAKDVAAQLLLSENIDARDTRGILEITRSILDGQPSQSHFQKVHPQGMTHPQRMSHNAKTLQQIPDDRLATLDMELSPKCFSVKHFKMALKSFFKCTLRQYRIMTPDKMLDCMNLKCDLHCTGGSCVASAHTLCPTAVVPLMIASIGGFRWGWEY